MLPGIQLVVVERVREREHGNSMAMLGEFRGGFGADALRGRVRSAKARVLLFELLQLAKQLVVLGIGHLGTAQHVVRVICPVQHLGEVRRALSSLVVVLCFSLLAAQRPLPSS